MLVYVCCATGNTSGMFCKQIQKASCREQIYVEEIHELGNRLEDALRENDLVLAYGSAEIIDEKFIRRYHFEYHMQAIWLAPQMRYLKDSMKKKLNCFDIPIHIIDMKTFGKMDGKQALQYILNAMI